MRLLPFGLLDSLTTQVGGFLLSSYWTESDSQQLVAGLSHNLGFGSRTARTCPLRGLLRGQLSWRGVLSVFVQQTEGPAQTYPERSTLDQLSSQGVEHPSHTALSCVLNALTRNQGAFCLPVPSGLGGQTLPERF